MEERAWIMKIASLKFSDEKKPSLYDVKIDENGNVHYYEEPSFYDVEIDDDGNVRYYNERGQLHRLDGPAVERADGTKEWYQDDMPHREDGPALELSNGGRGWFEDGLKHRLDGPAIIWPDGTKEWWVQGIFVGTSMSRFTQKKFERWKKEHGL